MKFGLRSWGHELRGITLSLDRLRGYWLSASASTPQTENQDPENTAHVAGSLVIQAYEEIRFQLNYSLPPWYGVRGSKAEVTEMQRVGCRLLALPVDNRAKS